MNKKRVMILGVLFGIFLCVLLIGTIYRYHSRTQMKQEETYTIGVVIKSEGSEYWASVTSGMETAAKEKGAELIILAPDSETNGKMQVKLLTDLIQKQVDVLAVSPVDSYDATYLDEAKEHGIPIVAFDTKIRNADVPYIGVDNRKVGEEIAKTVIETIGTEGVVGVVTGNLAQSAHRERQEGFCDYLSHSSQISVAFVESGYSNKLMPEARMSELLSEYPDLDAVFATSGVTALGLVDYLNGQTLPVFTVDAQQDAINAVKNGKITALAAQSGYDIGYKTIQYILEHKRANISEMEDFILDVEILTKDNASDWE